MGVQPLILYGSTALGPNAYNMELAMKLLGVPFEIKRFDILKGEHKNAEFRKVHPDQRVPGLLDPNFKEEDGTPLAVWESGSILLHIFRNYDKKGLFYSNDPVALTQTENWVQWTGSAVIALSYQIIYKKYTYMDPALNAAITKNQEELVNYWRMVDDYLSGKTDGRKHEFLVGKKAGIAEIVLFGWVKAFKMLGLKDEDFPNVMAWADRTHKALDIEKHIGESLATTAAMMGTLPGMS